MELRKLTDLVPAAQSKQQLHQKLLSHSEAKLESIDISLFCPLTHSRMVTPVRGKDCRHVHCFDGEAFCNLMWEKEIAKWKCPVSSTHQNINGQILKKINNCNGEEEDREASLFLLQTSGAVAVQWVDIAIYQVPVVQHLIVLSTE